MTVRERNYKKFILFLVAFSLGVSINRYGLADEYSQVPGLIDLRTDFSDGAHTLDYIIKLAKKRSFRVLFINDHDRKVLEYGIRPFQDILKKKVEESSINKGRPENYLDMINSASKRYPEMILIPGAESAPFYYWEGSYFKRNLTVCDWEKHLIIVGLEKPKDYKELPILHNGFSTKFILSSIPEWYFFLSIPLILSFCMIRAKRGIRRIGIVILVFTLLLLLINHPFRSSPYDQYQGSQGISPYQLLIDYVNSRGGMVFWNHPETLSGYGRIGPISKSTAPYPEVLTQSKYYTGFVALCGERTTVTEPGNIWDQTLIEYCQGKRGKPAWGISSADFHKEGAAGARLGRYPTIFLVKDRAKKDILDAMKEGRMYACAGSVELPRLVLEDFSVSDSKTHKGIMGEEMFLQGNPTINIRISTAGEEKGNTVTVRLIRYGKPIKTFSGETPLNVNFQDEFFKTGKRIYYRLDAVDKKGRKLVSNPIFVRFKTLSSR